MLCSIMSLTVISWGTDVPQLIINHFILLLFFKQIRCFIASFANYYRTGKVAFF